MLESVTEACSFLLIRRNMGNALSPFTLDMGKARGFNAQRERMAQAGACILRNSGDSTIFLKCTSDVSETLLPAG